MSQTGPTCLSGLRTPAPANPARPSAHQVTRAGDGERAPSKAAVLADVQAEVLGQGLQTRLLQALAHRNCGHVRDAGRLLAMSAHAARAAFGGVLLKEQRRSASARSPELGSVRDSLRRCALTTRSLEEHWRFQLGCGCPCPDKTPIDPATDGGPDLLEALRIMHMRRNQRYNTPSSNPWQHCGKNGIIAWLGRE